MKEYRVKIKVTNNRLSRAIEEAGFQTGQKFCEEIGIKYSRLLSLINLKSPAVDRHGDYWPDVLTLCEKLNKMPCDLFSDEQLYSALDKNTSEIEMDCEEVKYLICASDPLEVLELKESLYQVLDTLPGREAEVLKLRYGLEGDEKSQGETGKVFDVTASRIMQIEQKALRHMRHTTRSTLLRPILSEMENK